MGHRWDHGVWRVFAVAAQYEAAIKKAWDSEELREFMKTDDADNGAALQSLGGVRCRACCRRRGSVRAGRIGNPPRG